MLTHHPLFQNVPCSFQNKLIIRSYAPQDMIYNEGDICQTIGIVIKGEIEIATITHHEKEETITILKENDIFGDILLFSSHPFYLGHVIAKKKSEVAFISKQDLFYLFHHDKYFLQNYLTLICDKALHMKLQAKLFSHKNIEDRILYYFSTTADKDGYIFCSSIAQLSRILSLPRPSVSRSIQKLLQKGIIKKEDKHQFWINKQSL